MDMRLEWKAAMEYTARISLVQPQNLPERNVSPRIVQVQKSSPQKVQSHNVKP